MTGVQTCALPICWTGYAIYKKCVIGTSFAVWLGPEWASALTTIGFSFGVGWVVGSIIMGLYLLISLQGYGRHGNEAFSSLKIKDYKNFLRLHITKDGIDIYPIKIEKVPNWSGSPKAQARDNDRSWPELIEPAVIKVPN